jgi:putative ABC transport system ATP-binding protein
MTDATPHLRLSGVRFAHAEAAGVPARTVLEDAGADIGRGDFVVLTGPSGAGKSTLLRLICRLEEPQAGRILLSGRDIRELAPPRLRRAVAYLQQTPAVGPGSLRDNLLLPFTFSAAAGLIPPTDAELSALLDRLAMADVPLGQEAASLSVGQRQRLCFARALLTKPEALLLDEPTSALDAQSARAVLDAAETCCLDGGVTVLLVTHADYAPGRVRPRWLALSGGRLQWTA